VGTQKDMIIQVYITGRRIQCVRSCFSLRKVMGCYVPKSP